MTPEWGCFRDSVRPTTRTPHGEHARGAGRNQTDYHLSLIARLGQVAFLPILWAACVAFKIFVLAPGFYFTIEGWFSWAVEEGTPAFRFGTSKKGRQRWP